MCFLRKKSSLRQRANETVYSLMSVSELSTVEYTVKKIVQYKDLPLLKIAGLEISKIGERKFLGTCTMHIKAGIDLSQYTPDDLQVNETSRSITLTLPHAKINNCSMPPDEQRQLFEKIDWLRHKFTAEEYDKMLENAENSIADNITETRILADAEANIRKFFIYPLKRLGFQYVNIIFKG